VTFIGFVVVGSTFSSSSSYERLTCSRPQLH